MKRIVTTGPLQMTLEEAPLPIVVASSALIRVEAVGLCGSDYHLFDGTHPYTRYPQVQGHEVVGQVVEMAPTNGESERGVQVGDRVVVEPLISCGVCLACRRGSTNCCVDLKVLGVHEPGGLAEYWVVPLAQLHSAGNLPPELAVLAEPLTIGIHAVSRAEVGPGDRVVVIGAGPIGQAATIAARDRGAEVLVADRVARRLASAELSGAAATVDTDKADLVSEALRFTGGEGPRVVIEATGRPTLLELAVDVVAHSGTVVVVGISTEAASIPVIEFSRKELNVLGSRNSVDAFPNAVQLLLRNPDRAAHLVTHRWPLSQTEEAIQFSRAQPELVDKAIIVPDGSGK